MSPVDGFPPRGGEGGGGGGGGGIVLPCDVTVLSLGWTATAAPSSATSAWDEWKARTRGQNEDVQSRFALIVGADAAPYGLSSWLLILQRVELALRLSN